MIRRFLVAGREHAAARWMSQSRIAWLLRATFAGPRAEMEAIAARRRLAFWDRLLDAYTRIGTR